ncbi:MAG: molybdopterin guanine dinucleotide synthesis [Paracoccaceae bacterium]
MFDRVAVLDWSAAKGPRRGKDSIWLGEATISGCTACNIPTRSIAEKTLFQMISNALAHSHRLLLGVDISFGAPQGFIKHVTGQPEALAWWSWLAERVCETPTNTSNYRHVAAGMNGLFSSDGPFWGNGEKAQIDGLPRLKPLHQFDFPEHRATDLAARGPGSLPKPVWQLAGAGAVGAQVLTGLPVLERLRQHFAGQVAIWPFQTPSTPIVLAEVYPSLLANPVRRLVATTGMVPDEAQVRLLAMALLNLSERHLERMFTIDQPVPEEGWILGAGHGSLLLGSLG